MKKFTLGLILGLLTVFFPRTVGALVLLVLLVCFVVAGLILALIALCVKGDPANKGND